MWSKFFPLRVASIWKSAIQTEQEMSQKYRCLPSQALSEDLEPKNHVFDLYRARSFGFSVRPTH